MLAPFMFLVAVCVLAQAKEPLQNIETSACLHASRAHTKKVSPNFGYPESSHHNMVK